MRLPHRLWRHGRCYVRAAVLAPHPQRPGRYTGMFVGDDHGRWEYWPKVQLGARQRGWTWEAVIGLSGKNDGKNLSVEGATEHHAGFQTALRELVAQYPDLHAFVVSFDGPYLPVTAVLGTGAPAGEIDWLHLRWYHGTTSLAVPDILAHGLRPRGTGASVYGSGVGAKAGRRDAVYLTTQLGMAHFAALEAARRGGRPFVLLITGLDDAHLVPDEDSGELTAAGSLQRIGSVAHVGTIASRFIHRHSELSTDGAWR